ncbi:hypothetical protein IWW57_004126 [Coemansia sp. S610]|nr:hypothetical protein GGI06_003367 [Coemansia sp. S85]KAJ2023417.1 hypothetical protein IWW57_004126 [Coemansia sp. S610]
MQTLPRLQLSASREQHQNSPRSDNLLLSSSFPMVKSIGSSQGSAATLIDSDLWSSTAQFKSFGLEQQPAKPFDMRSFPLSSSGPAPTLEAAGTACLGFTGGVDPLGIYCNGAYIPCDRQQQLRRQHSTGDWLSLRSAAHQQAPMAHTLLPSFADSRLLLEPFDDCGLYKMVDNRPDSLETASAIDSGMARDADPFGVYHKGAFIPSSHHQQQLRRQHSTDDWISLRGTAHRQAPATLKLLPSSVNPRSLLESSDDRGMYAMMDGRFNSLEHLRSATSTRKQLGTHSIKGI